MYFYKEEQIAYCVKIYKIFLNLERELTDTSTVFDTVGITVEYVNGR